MESTSFSINPITRLMSIILCHLFYVFKDELPQGFFHTTVLIGIQVFWGFFSLYCLVMTHTNLAIMLKYKHQSPKLMKVNVFQINSYLSTNFLLGQATFSYADFTGLQFTIFYFTSNFSRNSHMSKSVWTMMRIYRPQRKGEKCSGIADGMNQFLVYSR